MPRYVVVGNLYDCNSDFCDREYEAANPLEAFVMYVRARLGGDICERHGQLATDQEACIYIDCQAYDAVVIGPDLTRYAGHTLVPNRDERLLGQVAQKLREAAAIISQIENLWASRSVQAETAAVFDQALGNRADLYETIARCDAAKQTLVDEWARRCATPTTHVPDPAGSRQARVVDLDTPS